MLLSDRHPVLFCCRFTTVTWSPFTLHVSSVILLWISTNALQQAVPANVTPRTFCMLPVRLINFPTNGIARTLRRNARSLTLTSWRPVILSSHGNAEGHGSQLALPCFSSNNGFSRICCEQWLTFEH